MIKNKSLARIKAIHQLSRQYNGKTKGAHQKKLLQLMREHIDEIEELAAAKNKHFLIETGDLIILCFELLLENRTEIDEVIVECFGRYEKKLKSLIELKK
ncbi:MAG: hypothetical protein HQL25_00210 [Candidatus Omnitrophica bacterium]|nr:hypothetical protein [Candidatus Omnitrophota bacterium]